MRTEDAMTAEVVELLRTLIRNACVNDGTDASGHEIRSADTLEAYLSGVGLAMERYTAGPGRVNLVTRIDGRDRRAPTLLLLGHRSEEHTSELQSRSDLVCRLLLEKKKKKATIRSDAKVREV